jgi:hypothetical protein
MSELYNFIKDQNGTATKRQCCDFFFRSSSALDAEFDFLERLGHIKRKGDAWKAIRPPVPASMLPLVKL